MTKNKFTEEQVVRLLQEAESVATTVTDLCREKGITKKYVLRLETELRRHDGRGVPPIAQPTCKHDALKCPGPSRTLPPRRAATPTSFLRPALSSCRSPDPALPKSLFKRAFSFSNYNAVDTRVGKVDSSGTATYMRDGVGVTDAVLTDSSATYTPGVSEANIEHVQVLSFGPNRHEQRREQLQPDVRWNQGLRCVW